MRKAAVKRKHHPRSYSHHKNLDLNHIKRSLALLTHAIEKNTSSAITEASHRTADVKKDIDHYVAEKPYRSMGVIMLAGICIGYIIHRH